MTDRIDRFLIFLINLCAQVQGNPIFLQKDHYFSHLCLLTYLRSDLPGFFLTDPLYLCQSFRFFLDNTQAVISKSFHDPACQRFTDSFNGTTSQITADAFRICRLNDLVLLHLKLFAIIGIIFHLSGNPQHCPLHITLKNTGNDQFLFFIVCRQHTIAVALVAVDHMVYKNLQCFQIVPFLVMRSWKPIHVPHVLGSLPRYKIRAAFGSPFHFLFFYTEPVLRFICSYSICASPRLFCSVDSFARSAIAVSLK